jgi:hypothetical protein
VWPAEFVGERSRASGIRLGEEPHGRASLSERGASSGHRGEWLNGGLRGGREQEKI